MKALQAQASVRRNAEEMGDYLRAMQTWEADAKKKDKDILRRRSRRPGSSSATTPPPRGRQTGAPPVRAGGGTVKTKSFAVPQPLSSSRDAVSSGSDTSKAPASHVYDKGYKRWESFDVDKALADMDQEDQEAGGDTHTRPRSDDKPGDTSEPEVPAPRQPGRPASLMSHMGGKVQLDPDSRSAAGNESTQGTRRRVPVARGGGFEPMEVREQKERERGNALFKQGKFREAIRAYTTCIGIWNGSVSAFSNRSLCHLKLKDWAKAVADASIALKLDPDHVKALQRRAVARNALGQHRAAISDLSKAHDLADASARKAIVAELRKCREALKSAMRNAPSVKHTVSIAASPALPVPVPSHPAPPASAAAAPLSPSPDAPLPTQSPARQSGPEGGDVPQASGQASGPMSGTPQGSSHRVVIVEDEDGSDSETEIEPGPQGRTESHVQAPVPAQAPASAHTSQPVSASVASPQAGNTSKPNGKTGGKTGKKLGQQKASKSAARASKKTPKGPYELERMLRQCTDQQAKILAAEAILQPSGEAVRKCFGTKSIGTLDADVLCDLLVSRIRSCVKTPSNKAYESLVESLRVLVSAPRFESSSMFLSSKHMDAIKAASNEAKEALVRSGATSSIVELDSALSFCD